MAYAAKSSSTICAKYRHQISRQTNRFRSKISHRIPCTSTDYFCHRNWIRAAWPWKVLPMPQPQNQKEKDLLAAAEMAFKRILPRVSNSLKTLNSSNKLNKRAIHCMKIKILRDQNKFILVLNISKSGILTVGSLLITLLLTEKNEVSVTTTDFVSLLEAHRQTNCRVCSFIESSRRHWPVYDQLSEVQAAIKVGEMETSLMRL